MAVSGANLFLGHGSPMNAIESNIFTQAWRRLGELLPTPDGLLIISAHWITDGIKIQCSPNPKLIYDFHGFPPELSKVRYPAVGSPRIANELLEILNPFNAETTETWGLDHGAWSLLIHMYPKAEIPVLQMSLDKNRNLLEHIEIAEALQKIRNQNILVIASGNIVHNLRTISWDSHSTPASWALEFEKQVCELALQRNNLKIAKLPIDAPRDFQRAHPTIDHFLPLLYTLGCSTSDDKVSIPIRGIQNSSISMASIVFQP